MRERAGAKVCVVQKPVKYAGQVCVLGPVPGNWISSVQRFESAF